jgi:LacI family transcriptional regulator
MTDVAREAGCSQATVSLVLNHNETIKISTQTRERVFAAARALNYSSGTISLPSAPATSGPIGFVVDQLSTSPEAIVAIEGARQTAWGDARVILVGQTQSDPRMERKTLETMMGRDLSALIYMTIFTREIEPPAFLGELEIPVVLLNCFTRDRSFPAVVPSEIAGGQTATTHLIRKGHVRIGTIVGEAFMSAAQDRLEGYRRALATADLPFDPELVAEGNWSASAGYDATIKLMALKDRPTAIFCQNDRMAIGCYEALKEAGLRIPDDISVVGYDDEEISRHLHPRLTTSILPHRAMGQWAVEQIETHRPRRERYPVTKLECALVERDSVAVRPATI